MDSKIIPSVQSDHSAIVLKLSPTNEGERTNEGEEEDPTGNSAILF